MRRYVKIAASIAALAIAVLFLRVAGAEGPTGGTAALFRRPPVAGRCLVDWAHVGALSRHVTPRTFPDRALSLRCGRYAFELLRLAHPT